MNLSLVSSLRWYRLSLELINIRAIPAMSAHPLSVIQAIVKGTTLSIGGDENSNLFFHIKDRKHTF
ncbi:MAG: hypothetical protein AB1595_03020, partial [bacterium]